MDEKRRVDSQGEVARNREGRLAVRVRLLRLQSDPASEDPGSGSSMRLNVPPERPDPRSAGRQWDDVHVLSTGDRVKKCLQQMKISVFQQAPSAVNQKYIK